VLISFPMKVKVSAGDQAPYEGVKVSCIYGMKELRENILCRAGAYQPNGALLLSQWLRCPLDQTNIFFWTVYL
jgi:hypothetical protein